MLAKGPKVAVLELPAGAWVACERKTVWNAREASSMHDDCHCCSSKDQKRSASPMPGCCPFTVFLRQPTFLYRSARLADNVNTSSSALL